LRASDDPIEAIGMTRTKQRAAQADLVLWLSEASAPAAPAVETMAKVWPIYTKWDLVADGGRTPKDHLWISAATGAHLDLLMAKLAAFAQAATGRGEGALVTRERHRRALETAQEALAKAQKDGLAAAPELLAEDLRAGLRALERLIGRIDVEDVLGEIFSRFCIGK
jgi:tRNA modification GTPase